MQKTADERPENANDRDRVRRRSEQESVENDLPSSVWDDQVARSHRPCEAAPTAAKQFTIEKNNLHPIRIF